MAALLTRIRPAVVIGATSRARIGRLDHNGRVSFGVYVHYPWCTHRCPYCDFAVSTRRPEQGRYTRAVLRELDLRAPAFEGLECASLYIGGGTPSLWEPAGIAAIVGGIRRTFSMRAGAEVTLEANPESLDLDRLAAWHGAGVNRISIGVQSLDAGVLAKLGRRHGAREAEEAVSRALAVFDNVSVDLIYGARRSTVETARRDAEQLAAMGVPHVSAYALTLDTDVLAEEVPLARLRRQGRLPLPEDEDVLAQARALRSALRRAGLRRYEISNFARPGFESVHNRIYWRGESYLGLGAGAYGYRGSAAGGLRYGNARAPEGWLAEVEAGRLPTVEEDRLGPREAANEGRMLALRTRDGLPVASVPPGRRGEVESLVRSRLAVVRRDRLLLTSRGLDVHSAIAERLFE
jgi:oxygen-independent coproporphyrinogen-3 oxidase